nr:class1 collagenase [Hathewaya histolytica]
MKKNILKILMDSYSKESKIQTVRRVTSVSLLAVYLTMNTSSLVLAKPIENTNDTSIKNVEKLRNAPNEENSKKVEDSKNDKVEHVKNIEEAKVEQVAPEVKSKSTLRSASIANTNSEKYDFEYLNGLSYTELTNLIKNIKWNQINGLFNYSTGSQKFFGDKNRVQAIINALQESGRTYTANDMKGIETFTEVLRAGFYLGYYNDGLSYLNDRNFQDKCIPAMIAIQKNPNFKLGTAVQDEVITSLGKLIGNASANAEVVNNCVPVLKQFRENLNQYAPDYVKGTAVNELIKGIEFDFSGAAYEKDVKTMPWYGKIDPFINELKALGLYGNITSATEWASDVGIYYLSKFGLYSTNRNDIVQSLEKAVDMYKYGKIAFVAMERITWDYDGIGSNGKKVDHDKFLDDAEKHYLPKTYTFDNGTFIIRAGDKVSEEKIKRLYWASREVKSQFHRVVGNDKALEVGNADDVLTMKIFNSPEEYKFNTNINGVSTDNGGLYIEPRGTFYTYERTPQQSIFSLEELFRHEYTHYLQARYLVDGLWGQGPFYEKNRLTWFDEGTAEFFAGSTRTSGVLPRKSILGYLAKDKVDHRYSLKKTLNSGYDDSDWMVYNYGFAVAHYLYEKDMPTFIKMNKAILNTDVKSYDEIIKKLSDDANKNTDYQTHIQELADKYQGAGIPLVSDDYLKDHGYKKASEVYSEISKAASLTNTSVTAEKSQYFNTFTLRGTYTGETSKGEFKDWDEMSKKLDGTLESLAKNSWSGYKTLTAYFTNYRVTSDNKVQYDVVFHGVLTDNADISNNKAPIAKVTGPSTGAVGRNIEFSGKDSKDEDGKIVSYDWDFVYGATSRGKNSVHAYKKAGTYNVTLKVTDDKGATATESFTIEIKNEDTTTPITKEMEPNDDIKEANGPIVEGVTVKGDLNGSDDADTFYFDVKEDGDVTIELPYSGSSNFTWLVYKEGDDQNHIASGIDKNNSKVGTFKSTKGRHYVFIYKHDSASNISYSLNIKGLGNEKLKEKENNDSSDKATVIPNFNTTMQGSLLGDDSRDYYSFEVKEEGEVNIELDKKDEFGVTWTLHPESNINDRITYGQVDGNKVSNKVKLRPGKYYLLVYKYSGSGNYELRVNK